MNNATGFDEQVEQQLARGGWKLPPAPGPAGNYSAVVQAGNLLFLSGQFPIQDGVPRYLGRVGAELTEQQGYLAAQLAALNVLAQLKSYLGSFDKLASLVRVEGHVSSAPNWNNTPKVLDGASDLFKAILGERGRHARTAFNPAALPWNLAVELVVIAAAKEA
jgi:enamine deaminase RidA (YjgF/YER057c/UK114 family)